jgi:NitT/TauT family transport system substrate-binding protein
MTDQPARLTLLGKVISIVLIVGLLGFGGYLVMKRSSGGKIFQGGKPTESAETEAPDLTDVTTVKEYKYIPADKLPAVKGVSQYRWDAKEKILRFSYNVWAGWLPVIAANGGTKPNTDSIFYKRYGFRVEMVLMDDPVAARDAFAAGEVHTLWGTADMMVLLAPELVKDTRTAPRIMQQIDWSSGGDGIVVRRSIKSASDLRNKTVALAQNSPSEYYLTSLLLSAGLRPSDLKLRYTATAFEAAYAFVADKRVDACVSWAPDIYRIPERVAGTRVLSSTSDANKLIADVYAVRADFARDHPDVVEGLVSGIFEGMDLVKQSPEQAAKWMADAFGMKQEDVMSMRNDAHLTNFAENVQFFLNSSNPTNFERTWKNASYIYTELGRISSPIPFDQVMDFSVLQKLQKAGAFAHQKDESVAAFTPSNFRKVPAESPILTQTIRINFYPNSSNPYEPARDEFGNAVSGKLYDPNVEATLEQVARLSGQFARAVILIEGHADSSMRGRIPVQAVRELSMARADAIRRALVEKFKFDPNKFSIQGKGWDVPADPNDPNNQALNRRVEISVFPPEQK